MLLRGTQVDIKVVLTKLGYWRNYTGDRGDACGDLRALGLGGRMVQRRREVQLTLEQCRCWGTHLSALNKICV